MSVSTRFSTFLSNLTLSSNQKQDGITKHTGIRKCLNYHYYNMNSQYGNSILVGSWGKSTEMRPPRDIDLLFELPDSVYYRFLEVPFWRNKQSEILQEVKRVLDKKYTRTTIRADGQVISVPFHSYSVEVVPDIKCSNDRYWICDTNDGGSFEEIDPLAEQNCVQYSNNRTNGNTRDLIRMMKCWQSNCNVPLTSFQIELLCIAFLRNWEYAGEAKVYYDWMARDFFKYLINEKKNGLVIIPGVIDILFIGNDWVSRAKSGLKRAKKAIEYEYEEKDFDAGWEWQKIFGSQIPLTT